MISGENPVSEEVLTRVDVNRFSERVGQMATSTREYNGALSDAWDEVQVDEWNRDYSRRASPQKRTSPPDHIVDLGVRIQNARLREVVLEASHAYLYDSMDDDDLRASMEEQYGDADALSRILASQGIRVRRVLFVDNYNPPPGSDRVVHNLDMQEYVEFACDHGYAPEYVIWEGGMERLASELVEYMREQQDLITYEEENVPESDIALGSQFLSYRKTELVKNSGKMSCTALDTALCVLKFRHLAAGVVNILPRTQKAEGFSFRGQQRKVRRVLGGHYGVRALPFFNAFSTVDAEGQSSSGAHHSLRKKVS
jgi:hypothetical protein